MGKVLKRDLIRNELNLISQMHGGVLQANDAVAYARKNRNSALHSCLNWDNDSAGEAWRLHQMRNIIKAVFVYEVVGTEERKYRGFWSFIGDRKNKGGGYTPVVLSSKEMRNQMLAEALMELQVFEAKYAELKDLVEAVSSIRRKFTGRKKKAPVMPMTRLAVQHDRPQPSA